MSHQTGIHCNEELRGYISKCKQSGSIRLIKVAIKDEQLSLDEFKEPNQDWKEDYRSLVSQMVLSGQPCYLLFRLDSVDGNGAYQWILITWSPENSPVREKMLYASTKATLKMEFGGGAITGDYFATNQDELTLESYMSWEKSKKDDKEAPLTREEQELREVKRDEALSSCISKTNRSLPGVEFQIDDEVISALFDMKQDQLSYVQMSIDMAKEVIKLDVRLTKDKFEISQIRSLTPDNGARYHLIVFPHTYDGETFKSVIFIYSIPGNGCPVKQRMLYSSCKGALINAITDQDRIGINIDKKLEIDNPAELTREFLIDELHPQQNIVKSKFDKPKGPQGKRGGKRLIKSGETNDDQ